MSCFHKVDKIVSGSCYKTNIEVVGNSWFYFHEFLLNP